ncbi:MAG: cardiolipin synthase [Lachnospiraceae bacterium]|nr:cardiolipin synthase [Lachnospiraceae bacterium]
MRIKFLKIMKMLFSKIALSFLMLSLQVAAMVFFAYKAAEAFVWFQTASIVLSVILVLIIINKVEPSEYKVPWIILIMLLPIFGATIYVLFANPTIPARTHKRLSEISAELSGFSNFEEDTDTYLDRFVGVDRYLVANGSDGARLNNRISYFPIGEEFFEDFKAELKKAERFIFLEYFIIDPGQMWDETHEILLEKVARGVDVRIIYDEMGTLGKLKSNFYKTLCREGIKCIKFNPFIPVVSGIYNNRDHRKIVVIDGKVGYTGGLNIGDEYINKNKRLGIWKDNAIKIEGNAVDGLTKLFLISFDQQTKSNSDYASFLEQDAPSFPDEPGAVTVFGDGPRPFYSERIGENNFLNLISLAKERIWITTPYLIPDYTLLNALRIAAMRGVEVKIVTPHIPDKLMVFGITKSNYEYLLDAGVEIYEYTPGFMHAKTMLIDDEAAFVGTINLDYRSLVHHYEDGAVLYYAPCLSEIKQDYLNIIAQSEPIANDYHLKLTKLITAIFRVFSPML